MSNMIIESDKLTMMALCINFIKDSFLNIVMTLSGQFLRSYSATTHKLSTFFK